jgi:hypothetical protein
MKKATLDISDKIGNVGFLKVKGTPEEPIFVIREAPKVPTPNLEFLEKLEDKAEPNGHDIDEREIARSVATRWREFR